MWEVKGRNRNEERHAAPPMIEALEGRDLFSVAVHAAAPKPKPPAPHAIVMSHAPKVQPTANPTIAAFPTYVPPSIPGSGPDIVGTWSGTMLVDGSITAAPFSINFTFQRGVAASGVLNLGPTVGNQTQASTLVFSPHRVTRMLILTPTLWMGFSGSMTSDGKTLSGRFAVNASTGWQTGTYSLTRG